MQMDTNHPERALRVGKFLSARVAKATTAEIRSHQVLNLSQASEDLLMGWLTMRSSHSAALMKSATVYRRKHVLYVHPKSRTTDGLWIVTDPILKLDEPVGDSDIGSAIRAALDRSESNVPRPTNWDEISKVLLKGTGASSWSKFVQSTSCVIVTSTGDELSVMPTENRGARGGFAHEPDKVVVLRQASVSELGAVARKLLT